MGFEHGASTKKREGVGPTLGRGREGEGQKTWNRSWGLGECQLSPNGVESFRLVIGQDGLTKGGCIVQ